MYHFFFILSSVNGDLGCFHVLAIVNSAAVNTGVHASFQIRVFYMPRPKLCLCPASAPILPVQVSGSPSIPDAHARNLGLIPDALPNIQSVNSSLKPASKM